MHLDNVRTVFARLEGEHDDASDSCRRPLIGLAAGILLGKIGWQVDIFERSPRSLSSRNRDAAGDIRAATGSTEPCAITLKITKR